MLIAKFKNIELDFEVMSNDVPGNCDDYIRLTEYVDVNFKELNRNSIVEKELAALNSQMQKIQANTESEVNKIKSKINDLLALPNLGD